ncbi:cysteine hydrolase, partial [Leucobacter sp. OLES1]
MTASATLRSLSGLPQKPASLADATLVLIDFQNTYTTGAMELEGWAPALEAAADLLARARAAGATVI